MCQLKRREIGTLRGLIGSVRSGSEGGKRTDDSNILVLEEDAVVGLEGGVSRRS